MYLPTLKEQTYAFLMCIGFGFLLGFFYDILRFIRKSFLNFKRSLIIQDILFCVISTFLTYCFLLCVNNGEVRVYTLTGLSLGFIIYYFTFGSIIVKLFDALASLIHKIIYPFKKIFRKVIKKLKNFSKNDKNKANNT